MRRTFLLKSLLLLCALVAGSSSVWATEGDEITNHANIVSGKSYYIKALVGETSYYLKFTDATGTNVTGTDDTSTSNAQIIKIESAGSENTFYLRTTNGYYLTPGTSNGKLNISSTATSVTASTSNNVISFSIKSGNDTWILQRNSNSGTHNFGGYKSTSSQKKVTLIEAAPAKVDIATIGDINTKKIDFNEIGTFSVDITGNTGITASDYTVAWTEVDNAKLTLLEDGTYEAKTEEATTEVTVTVTPSAAKSSTHKAVSKSFNVRIFDPTKNNGTTARPYTVSEALSVNTDGTTDDKKGVCVSGIISNIYYVNTDTDKGYAKYDISADGNTSGDQLQAYNGYYTGNTKFTSADQIAVGDIVVVCGDLTTFNTSTQLNTGNYIVSHTPDTRVEAGLAWSEDEVEIDYQATSYTLPSLTNPHNLVVTYSITGTEGLASESAGVITVDTSKEGTATVTASFAGNDDYKAASVSYTITVADKNKKGSIYNPYTVAEVRGQTTATTFGNGIYVTGYIVGCVDGGTSKCYKTTTNSLVNTNLLLADTPDVSFNEGVSLSSTTGMIPVELPSGTIRTNWNIKTNNVLGYKVLIKGNAQAYFSSKGIKGTSEISTVSVPIAIACEGGYASYSCNTPLDFTNSGAEAYIIKTTSENSASLTQVTKVPANTGIIVKGTKDDVVNVAIATGDTDDVTGNLLKGTVNTPKAVALNEAYGLSKTDGKFHLLNAGTIPANKAYLLASEVFQAGAAAVLDLDFGETTGVNTLNVERGTLNGECYNLNGQRIAQPTKGLYIVNGRKVVIK